LKSCPVFVRLPLGPDLVFWGIPAALADFASAPFMVFSRGPASPRLPRKSPTFWLIFGDFRARPAADPAAPAGAWTANFENLTKPVGKAKNAQRKARFFVAISQGL
jgi:hypothetical protein